MSCIIDKCSHRAEFGTPSIGLVRCKTHVMVGDSKFPHECCVDQTCLQQAIYSGKSSQTPQHCVRHRQEDEICALMQVCNECKTLFSGARESEAVCRSCADKIQVSIDKLLDTLAPHTLDRSKTQVRLSLNQQTNATTPLVILQFVTQDKRDKSQGYSDQFADLAKTLKRAVIVLLCNTGDYKGVRKQQSATIAERIVTIESVIQVSLSSAELTSGSVVVKRVFFDGYMLPQ